MKTDHKKANMGMAHYLKKFWGANALAILPALAVCALQTGTSLVMIQTFQSIIERDLHGFGFWILMMVGAWFLLLGINSLQEFFQGRAVRAMNNAVRQDMAATLLQKNHGEFHRIQRRRSAYAPLVFAGCRAGDHCGYAVCPPSCSTSGWNSWAVPVPRGRRQLPVS